MQPRDMILTAFLSFGFASLGGFISSYLTIFVAKRKLKIDLAMARSVELFKKRLESYALVWEMLGALSEEALEPLNSSKALQVANKLNDWLYSTGGLVAHQATRRALLDVRNACLNFSGDHVSIKETGPRDTAMKHLRADLTLKGLESFDTVSSGTEDEIAILEPESFAARKQERQ